VRSRHDAGESGKEAHAMNQYLLAAVATSSTSPASIMPGHRRMTRWSAGLMAAIGLTASVLGSAATWLFVTDPVAVSNAIATGDAEVLPRVIEAALIDIVRILVAYL
jgi:hypothetical protein